MVAAKQLPHLPHYSLEDEPPPEALLQMYKDAQKEIANGSETGEKSYDALRHHLRSADKVAAEIEKWANDKQNEVFMLAMQEIRQALVGNYEQARQMFSLIEKYGAAESNANAVINQQINIIDQMGNELESLKLAISQGKTTDPRLEPIVNRIRQFVQADVEYTAYIACNLERIDELSHYIRYLKPEMDDMEAYIRATRLNFIVDGSLDKAQTNGTTSAERQAFMKLIEALEV